MQVLRHGVQHLLAGVQREWGQLPLCDPRQQDQHRDGPAASPAHGKIVLPEPTVKLLKLNQDNDDYELFFSICNEVIEMSYYKKKGKSCKLRKCKIL